MRRIMQGLYQHFIREGIGAEYFQHWLDRSLQMCFPPKSACNLQLVLCKLQLILCNLQFILSRTIFWYVYKSWVPCDLQRHWKVISNFYQRLSQIHAWYILFSNFILKKKNLNQHYMSESFKIFQVGPSRWNLKVKGESTLALPAMAVEVGGTQCYRVTVVHSDTVAQ